MTSIPPSAETSPPLSTRERIIGEATRQFADSGIKATTVARIEAAVGLRAGSGGVHRHFATKDDLVVAVLDALYERADNKLADAMSLGRPSGDDLGPFLRSIGSFILREADDLRELLLIGAREGPSLFERFPQYQQRSFTAMLTPIATDLKAMAEQQGGTIDADAAAFLFIAPLLYHRTLQWLTGETALQLSDEQVVEEWARQQELLLSAGRGR